MTPEFNEMLWGALRCLLCLLLSLFGLVRPFGLGAFNYPCIVHVGHMDFTISFLICFVWLSSYFYVISVKKHRDPSKF